MKVIDASALGAIAFAEPGADEVLAATGSEELSAPPLLPFEVTNIAWKKIRQRPDAIGILAGQLQDALSVPVSLVEVDCEAILRLAVKHRITSYDASYLWLARHLHAPLVTLDVQLRKLAATHS